MKETILKIMILKQKETSGTICDFVWVESACFQRQRTCSGSGWMKGIKLKNAVWRQIRGITTEGT